MKEFLNRFNLTLIISVYILLVFALYEQLNVYIVALGVGCAIWRVGHYLGRLSLMPPLLLNVVSIITSVLTVAVLYQQGVFAVLLHLVFLGFSLKFLELKAIRDVYFFVNTGFLLIALFFIFNTSVVAAFIALILVSILLAILLSLHTGTLRKKTFSTLLLKTLVLSLPLSIVLFLVIPRLPSLWKMPIQKQATTGLSDSVSPGEIANLSRSSALAFRATFANGIPSDSERYWRAMTLDYFDGKTWSQSEQKKQGELQAKRGRGSQFSTVGGEAEVNSDYELIIEPHYNYWLPVLDYAITPQNLVSLDDYSLRSAKPIIARKAFNISQMKQVNNPKLDVSQRIRLTQLPQGGGNAKTNKWINQKLKSGLSKEAVLNELLKGFTLNFNYTLQPPLLGENHIDDFLFTTQSGFCVHYASSYLYVARRLGIPARMVTGYLGGEWHNSEGFFTIRQYDAHAWVEIWQGNQWKRVDPTSYVAPERVESGLEASLTDKDEFLADEFLSLQKWQSIALLNELRSRLAQMDYLWARYVVNFDNQKQMKFLHYWLNKFPWANITYVVMLFMSTIFALLMLIIFKPWKKQKISVEDKIYLSLQKHFLKREITPFKGQTIGQYCSLLSDHYPQNRKLFTHFADRYNAIKYQPDMTTAQRDRCLRQLKQLAKQIKKYN